MVTIWLPRSTTLLGCLFRGYLPHVSSHLLSWTLFIGRHFLVGLISDECTLYLSVPQIRRDSQSNCQLVFSPFSIAPTHPRFFVGFPSTFIKSAEFLSIWIKGKKQNKQNKLSTRREFHPFSILNILTRLLVDPHQYLMVVLIF